MGIDSLKYGRNQPFYHVLVDTRDRPGGQITYVAQENIMIDTPSEPRSHPMLAELFEPFLDGGRGRYVPTAELRERYPLSERPQRPATSDNPVEA